MLPLQIAPLPAVFAAKIVPARLLQETRVSDARRDLSLVGTTERPWGDDRTRPVVVLKGRAVADYENPGGLLPVGLLSGGAFVVASRAGSPRATRRAKLVGDRLVLGRPVERSKPSASAAPFRSRDVPYRGPAGEQTVRARWWRVRGATVGSGRISAQEFQEGGAFVNTLRGMSYVRLADGRVAALERIVRGEPKLGAILWVSREGWIVCEEERGFARLYPIRGRPALR